MSAPIALRIIVRGRVQGVGYRAFVEREALKAGIEGWVCNRRDGSVEALLIGPESSVAALVEACQRGPFNARVDAIDRHEAREEDHAFVRTGERFSVLPTR